MKPKELVIRASDVKSFDAVRAIAFARAPGALVALCWGGVLRCWNVTDGTPIFERDGADSLNRLAVSATHAVDARR
jgi:hypothetical protein